MTLNDEILRVTGGPTVNEGLMSFYGGVGAVEDRERAFLLAQAGVTPGGTNQDLWMKYLVTLGHTQGDLNDRQLVFWSGL